MAMADEYFYEAGELEPNCVIQLQALIRGYLTRRNLQNVTEEYERIFTEIEGSEKVYWPRESLCLPKSQRRNPKKARIRLATLDTRMDDRSQENKPERTNTSDAIHVQEMCTAETQTSFTQDVNLRLSLGSSLVSDNVDEDEVLHEQRGYVDGGATPQDFVIEDRDQQEKFNDSETELRHISHATGGDLEHEIHQKSGDTCMSGGFPHLIKNSGSRSSSARSEGNTSRSKDRSVKSDRSEFISDRSELVKSARSEVKSARSEVKSDRSEVKSDRSEIKTDRSEVKSDRSEIKTARSEVKSDRSEVKSDRSEVKSDRSGVNSHRSEVKSDTSGYKLDRSDISLKNRSNTTTKNEEERTGSEGRLVRETSVTTNATSVWDSFSSATGYFPSKGDIPDDPATLMDMRKSVSMELLWVQQAINSRKNYLKIKEQMKAPVSSS